MSGNTGAASSSWELGSVSAHYEAAGFNPETISTGRGDHGGASYGVFQLASKSGTVTEYLSQSAYGLKFDGLEPGSDPFNRKWREITASDSGFVLDQRDFIAKTHYQPQISRLKADGVDLSHRGIAVQEALWSTSIQYRNMTKGIFEGALKEKFGEKYRDDLNNISDKNIVCAVQDYKLEHVAKNFRSSTPTEQNYIRRYRIPREKQDLIALAEGRTPSYSDISHLLTFKTLSSEQPKKVHEGHGSFRVDETTSNNAFDRVTGQAAGQFHGSEIQSRADYARGVHDPQMQQQNMVHRSERVPPVFEPFLGEGSHGHDVSEVQSRLNALNYTGPDGRELAADGRFGPATRYGVEEFQRENGLKVDGFVGPETHRKLDDIHAVSHMQPISAAVSSDTARAVVVENGTGQASEPPEAISDVKAYWQNLVRKGQEHDAYTARQDRTAVIANRTGQTPEPSETVSDVKAYWQNVIRKGQACLDAEAQQGRINVQDQSRGNSMHM